MMLFIVRNLTASNEFKTGRGETQCATIWMYVHDERLLNNFWLKLLIKSSSVHNELSVVQMMLIKASVSMVWRKTTVTPVQTHWSYCSLAVSHRCNNECMCLPTRVKGNSVIQGTIIIPPVLTNKLPVTQLTTVTPHKSHAVSNQRLLDCLLNCLFRPASKKSSEWCTTYLCERNPLVTGGFPSQRANNAVSASVSCCYHGLMPYLSLSLSHSLTRPRFIQTSERCSLNIMI